jgi:hypothetical protein
MTTAGIITFIVVSLLCLGAGAFGTWFYLVKIKRPKVVDDAKEDIKDGEKNEDPERARIIKETEDQIRKNKELQEKIKEKLKNNFKQPITSPPDSNNSPVTPDDKNNEGDGK